MKKKSLVLALALIVLITMVFVSCVPLVLYTYEPPSWLYGTWYNSLMNPSRVSFSQYDINDSKRGSWSSNINMTFISQDYGYASGHQTYTVNFWLNGSRNTIMIRQESYNTITINGYTYSW